MVEKRQITFKRYARDCAGRSERLCDWAVYDKPSSCRAANCENWKRLRKVTTDNNPKKASKL